MKPLRGSQEINKMARSSWKGPYIGINFIKLASREKITNKNTEKRKLDILTYSRSSVIVKEWVGLNIGVHNGKSFVPVFVVSPMVGHKLGEFSRTRVKPVHPKKSDSKNKPGEKKNVKR